MKTHLEERLGGTDLHGRVERWVAASLISREQAEAIERFEESAVAAPRRVPLVTEALAYLGAALAAAAGGVLLADRWSELAAGARLAAIGGAFAVLFAGGWLLRANEEAAFARLGSVLWTLSSGALAWSTWLAVHDVVGSSSRSGTIAGGALTAVYAAALFGIRRRGLQQAALFGALVMAAVGIVWSERWGGAAAWGVGLAWVALASMGLMEPKRAAFVLGSAAAVLGPMSIAGAGLGAGPWMGLATSVALVAVSVPLRQTVALGFGVVGLFIYLVRVVGELFAGTAAMPIALVIAGALVFAVALAVARRSKQKNA